MIKQNNLIKLLFRVILLNNQPKLRNNLVLTHFPHHQNKVFTWGSPIFFQLFLKLLFFKTLGTQANETTNLLINAPRSNRLDARHVLIKSAHKTSGESSLKKYLVPFLINFFESYMSLPSSIKLINLRHSMQKYQTRFFRLERRLHNFQKKIGRGFFLIELFHAIWITIFFKDIYFFANWLKRLGERLFFKKHKTLFQLLRLLFKSYFKSYFFKRGCSGLKIQINGKIAIGGNAKTRQFVILLGKYSTTTKDLKYEIAMTTIRTKTGVLGATFVLSY